MSCRRFSLVALAVLACLIPGLRGLALCLCEGNQAYVHVAASCACDCHEPAAVAQMAAGDECACSEIELSTAASTWALPGGDPAPSMHLACVENTSPLLVLVQPGVIDERWTPQRLPRPPPGNQTLARLATVRLTI